MEKHCMIVTLPKGVATNPLLQELHMGIAQLARRIEQLLGMSENSIESQVIVAEKSRSFKLTLPREVTEILAGFLLAWKKICGFGEQVASSLSLRNLYPSVDFTSAVQPA